MYSPSHLIPCLEKKHQGTNNINTANIAATKSQHKQYTPFFRCKQTNIFSQRIQRSLRLHMIYKNLLKLRVVVDCFISHRVHPMIFGHYPRFAVIYIDIYSTHSIQDYFIDIWTYADPTPLFNSVE